MSESESYVLREYYLYGLIYLPRDERAEAPSASASPPAAAPGPGAPPHAARGVKSEKRERPFTPS